MALAIAFFASAAVAAPQLLTLRPAVAASGATAPGATIAERRAARFNADQMFALAPGTEVELTLPNGAHVPYVLDVKKDHGGGIRTWIGRHRDLGSRYRAIVTTGPAGSFGVFNGPDTEWRLVPGDGADTLVDMRSQPRGAPSTDRRSDAIVPPASAKRAMPTGAPPSPFIPLPGINSVPIPKAMPAPIYDVDLLIVYTRGFAQQLGANLTTRLYFIMEQLNTGYVDSEVAVRLRLVHTMVADYPESTSDNGAIAAISPGCAAANACTGGTFDAAAFGDVENQRAASGADLVLLMRGGSEGGGSGVAYIGANPPMHDYMYAVTTGCTLTCEWLFMHELGHVMGLTHDRATVEWQAGGTTNPIGGMYAYSFGYAYCASAALSCDPTRPSSSGGCTSEPECSTSDPDDFTDAMAYFHGSGRRNTRISNPDVDCFGASGVGHPCGIAAGQPDQANGALSINNYRAALASAVPTMLPDPLPGAVQFAAPTFGAAAASGAVTLTVSRIGGSGGAVQVSYATADGTAIAGTDYLAASGTLSWADGDASDRTITVALANPPPGGNKTFSVNLTHDSGSASLGSASAATVLVAGPWPADSALPAGLRAPGWSVANDSAFEGSTSVRSPLLYETTSVADFDGNFTAGTVAFAYRLSSAFAYFNVQLDGAIVYRIRADETGWRLFSFPIAAGHHTIAWTAYNINGQPCGQIAGAPAGCADRLWLDSLALPPWTASRSILSMSMAVRPYPATSGSPVTVTATVAGAAGTPTGSVAFDDGGTPIAGCGAAALTGGTATCVIPSLPPGPHTVNARYSGDSIYTAFNGYSQFTVNPAPTAAASLAVSSSANPSTAGDLVTLTVTASGSAGTPTGSVTFNDNGAAIGACSSLALSGGVAQCPISSLATGTHSITVTYSGDGSYAGGTSSAFSQAVNAPASGGALALTPTSLDFGGESMGTTSPARMITVTNTGGATVTIASVTTSPEFVQANDCTTLAPDATCTISVTFSPQPREGPLNASVAVEGQLTVASDAVGSPHTAGLSGSAEKSLVTHYYRSILRRAPDAAGHDFWESEAARVAGLGANVSETWYALAMSFFESPEYRNFAADDASFLADLYRTFFNRAPDEAGLAYWLDQLRNGMPRQGVLASFMFSPEFRNFTEAIFGAAPVRAEIDMTMDMYRGTLARLPDSAGFNFYLGEFRKAQCQGSQAVRVEADMVSSGFLNSAEYGNRARTNAQYMADLYNTIMRRGPDLAGISFYTNQLDTGAQTREQIRQQFVSSQEFTNRVTDVANAGCVQ